jgi:glycosyltransferase involved in cell wall biosynthesis
MINGFGPVFGYLGYQVHARKFFEALDRIEPVCLASNNPAGDFPLTPGLARMLARQQGIDHRDTSICIDYANNFHRFHGGRRIGFTVFEYTRLAVDWVNGMRQVDEIWTTSSWGRKIIAAHGIPEQRIGVVPEGFDPQVFHPGLRARDRTRGVFRFLTVGKWEVRKGQAELLRAWAQAFRGIDDVELVMMCDNPFVPGFSPQAEVLKLGLGPTAPVRHIRPVPSDRDMAGHYAEADCFVLPTRAEGWGLPIMEAMACGTPVITTRYSAMTDYADDANAYLLDVARLSPVHDPLFFPRAGEAGEWAEIDVDALAATMLHVYRNRDEAAARGARAAADMHARWTWDHAARIAHGLVAAARGAASVAPPPPAAARVRAGDRSPEALAALAIDELIAIAEEILRSGDVGAAMALYRGWIAHATSPMGFVARFNLGCLEGDFGDPGRAELLYREAMAQHPGFIQAMLNLGTVLERQGRVAEAAAEWDRAVASILAAANPDPTLLAHARDNLARVRGAVPLPR